MGIFGKWKRAKQDRWVSRRKKDLPETRRAAEKGRSPGRTEGHIPQIGSSPTDPGGYR